MTTLPAIKARVRAGERKPTPAQRKYLEAVRNAPLMRFVQPAAWATIRACERAGWTAVDGHGETRISPLGRAALTPEP